MLIRKHGVGSALAFWQYFKTISHPVRKFTLSRRRHVLLFVMLFSLVRSGHSLLSSGSERMDVILRTEVQADLFFHALAHMDIGPDASSLYSRAYIERISRDKIPKNIDPFWLTNEMNKIRDIYIRNQKLRLVNFIPFLFKDVEQLLAGLKWLSGDMEGNSPHEFLPRFKQEFSSSPDSQRFLRSLAEILETEYQHFYRRYWSYQQERLGSLKDRFRSLWEETGTKLIGPVMKEKQGVVVYLCLSMTRNGRGFALGNHFGAAVKFPEKEDEILSSFFMSIHEMTHLFLDEWTLRQYGHPKAPSSSRSGSEGYDLHLFKERAVLYADYLLCKRIVPALLPDYLIMFLELFMELNREDLAGLSPAKAENLFKARVSLGEKATQALEILIQGLLDSR